MSAHTIWYIARSSGLVSWALLAASVLWGLTLSTRTLRRWAKPAWVLDLHRFLGALTVVFVAIHIGALLLDTYVHFGLAEILVPLATSWHPVAVAWGIVGLYLLVAVEVTSLLRSRVPRALWRRVHYATIPLFATATVHGLTAGTDRGNMAVIFGAVAGIIGVAYLLVRRVGAGLAQQGPPRVAPETAASTRRPARVG